MLQTEAVLSHLVAEARRAIDQLGIGSLSSVGVSTTMSHLKELRGLVDGADAALRSRARALQPGPQPHPRPTPISDSARDAVCEPTEDTGSQTDVSPGVLDEVSDITAKEGRQRDRISRTLEHLPLLAEALTTGRITTAHIAAIAELIHTADERVWLALPLEAEALLEAATRMGPVPFKRAVTQIIRRIAAGLEVPVDRDLHGWISGAVWTDPHTGLGKVFATFDPTSHAHVSAIVSSAAAKLMYADRNLTRKEATGRALLAILTGQGSDEGATALPAVSVIIDQQSLVHGQHVGTICEHANGSRLPVETAQEMACVGTITPILHNQWGVVLDLGRDRRWVSSAQRRALESMYATCFLTSCDTPVTECHHHHIHHWEHGGGTDIGNLIPVCEHHHRWIHATGAHITMDEQRRTTLRSARGNESMHVPDRRLSRPVPPEPPDPSQSRSGSQDTRGQWPP